ncbi:MAG TPA: PAS domain S-box protein, partial [Actinoplanes sp.]|nr:PAS domain S-box protein [Actinoplanes sp.]
MLAGSLALSALLGYVLQIRQLAGAASTVPAMAPTRAFTLVLASIGLWLVAPGPIEAEPQDRRWRRFLGRVLGALVCSYGAILLDGDLAEVETGIEFVLFPDLAVAWGAPVGLANSSPVPGLLFMVIGLTLMTLDTAARLRFPPAAMLAVTGAVLAVFAFLGNIFGLGADGQVGLPGIGPYASVVFLLLTVGILTCRPEHPVVRPFVSSGLGGVTLRRLLPASLLVMGLLSALFAAVGAPLQRGLRITVAVTALLLLLYVVLLYTGVTLDRADQRTRALAGELSEYERFSDTVLDSLVEGVIASDAEGTILLVTPRWAELTGYPAAQVVGTGPPFPWWPPDEADERRDGYAALLRATSRGEYESTIMRADGSRVTMLVTTSPILRPDGSVKMVIGTIRDMTEHERAAAERRRLAEQRDHLFATSHDLMWIADAHRVIYRANPAWQRTLGYEPAELSGRRLADFVHPDDIARLREPGIAHEARFRHRDGSVRWINWTEASAPGYDDAVYAVGRDITVHRAADESRARLAAIVENTEEAIVGKTLDGIITSWNPAAERIYGYRAHEVIGKSIRMLVPPGRQADDYEVLAAAAQREPVRDHDCVRIRKDGTEIHVDLSMSPVRDGTGEVIATATIAREVTSRWRADERFRRLVLNAPVAMVMVDGAGVIRLVNQETERLFGYATDELLGRGVELLVPLELRERHTEQRQQYLAVPFVRTMGASQDLYGQRRDGSRFPVEVRLAPIDIGEDHLVSAVIHDITERTQVQVALAAARDEAVAVAKLRSQFVATVSHEIRTPMNGVIGLTNLLLDTGLSQTQRRYVDGIRTSSRALLAIINDILDFSKIESGKVVLTEADFDLGELV